MRENIDSKVQQVQTEEGHSISDQLEVVTEWWRELAFKSNPHLHHSFINELPIEQVTSFFVDKGFVRDTTAAEYLLNNDILEFHQAKR